MKHVQLASSLLLMALCGCSVEDGSPQATVRFTGTYGNGTRFAEGTLQFNPPGALLGQAVSGMARGERRETTVPVAECPGSPRPVEFGNRDDGEGVEEQFRYRRDRGPLHFELELTEICTPTYWTYLKGSPYEGRISRSCRPLESVEPVPEPNPEWNPPFRVPPPGELDKALLNASFGYGKDREIATVEALLAAGANPDAVDAEGRSALALAAETGNRAIPRRLFLQGARLRGSKFDGNDGLHEAAADGQAEILRALLGAGPVDVNQRDQCGFTPLLWALRNEASPGFDCFPGFNRNYQAILGELLAHGADPRRRQGKSSAAGRCVGEHLISGASPLHYAAAACHLEAVQLLLAHGAEVEVFDDMGDTPLMAAAHVGCPEIAGLLLDRGAGLETRDQHGGGAALDHAVTRDSFVQDNIDTVALLRQRGANPQTAKRTMEDWLNSKTGRGFGRRGLKNAREIARLLGAAR